MKSNPALLASALILSLAALPSSRGECHLICKELAVARQALAAKVSTKGSQLSGTPSLAKATAAGEATVLAQVLGMRRGPKAPKQRVVG